MTLKGIEFKDSLSDWKQDLIFLHFWLGCLLHSRESPGDSLKVALSLSVPHQMYTARMFECGLVVKALVAKFRCRGSNPTGGKKLIFQNSIYFQNFNKIFI